MPATLVTVIVNGQSRELSAPVTVAELLRRLEIPSRGVAVEVNLAIVPRWRHAEHTLADGDQLEIVTLVPGG
ncbi:MAG TPA: sulfur carrier protein ThiS [Pirellulaceae bacterium]|nr:sulfur carrier protein ThiS [Pirellulaceae bacterium]